MVCTRPILLIETYTLRSLEPIMRSYSTFNRDIQKIHQPILIIEPVLIIETQEYIHLTRRQSMKSMHSKIDVPVKELISICYLSFVEKISISLT